MSDEKDNALQFCQINLNKNLDIMEDFVSVILKKNPLYYDTSKMWYSWDEKKKKWSIIDKTDVVNIAKYVFGAIGLNCGNVRTQFMNAITDRARLKQPKELDKYYVQLKDNIIHIKSDEKIKVSSDYFAFNPIPWELGESEETPIIDEIFKEWVDDDYIKLQELCAYCMLPDYPFARFWILLGSGSNGKSTFFDFLSKFLGTHNICGSDLELLFNNQFETSKLYKKLACIIGEADYSSVKNSRKLKTITGNDPNIRYEFKGKDGFDGKNYAKVIISTNQLPETNDKTRGYYRRFICINFNKEFKEKYDILARIPKEEYNNFAKKCLGILKKLLENAKFTNEGSIEEKENLYEKLSNPFEEFKNLYLREKSGSFVEFSKLYTKYSTFLKEKRHNKISYNNFSALLRSNNLNIEKKNIIIDTLSRKYYFTVEEIPNYTSDDWKNQRLVRDRKNLLDGYELFETPETPLDPYFQSIFHIRNLTGNMESMESMESNCPISPMDMLLESCKSDNLNDRWKIEKEFTNSLIDKAKSSGLIYFDGKNEKYRVV